ncbi:HI1506-related protein [Escherichia coli]|uniref:Protein gp35 n=1 Tax=Escherichia coli TA447 TaxID=656447 RepID=A0A1X3J100_ECOLX|nr:HI1506-related protein [Escherichia coli]OSK94363.1 protein gp35 [Escherichia coli TA447]
MSDTSLNSQTVGTTGTTCKAVIKCLRPVYRRAGIAFTRGENTVEVTEEQLAIIRADSVLSVVSTTAAETLVEAGGLDVLGVGDLNARIRATVTSLDKENPEHFTAGGEPKVKAVSAALGENVTAAQIKAALAEAQA